MSSPFKVNKMAEHYESTGPNNAVWDSPKLKEERISQANELRVLAEKLNRLWVRWDTAAHKHSLYEPRANGMHGVEKAHGVRRTYDRLEQGLEGLAAIIWARTVDETDNG